MIQSRSGYESILTISLLLFSLSIPLSKSGTNIFIGVVYLSGLYFIARDPSFRRSLIMHAKQPLLLPLLLYFLVVIAGLIHTTRLQDGIEIFNKTSGIIFVYFMISVVLDSFHDEKTSYEVSERLLIVFLAGIFVLDLIAIMTYFGIVGQKKLVLPLAPLRVHHIWFSNLNAVGLYTTAALFLFSERGRDAKTRVFFIFFVVLALASILFSLSRTAWLGMVLTLLVMSFLLVRNKKHAVIPLIMVAGACVLLYLFNSLVHLRINEIFSDISHYATGQSNTSLGGRFLMWEGAVRMFLSNPLVGVGTGDYVTTMIGYVNTGVFPGSVLEWNQPHNMYLFALATNGVAGLSALLFIFYSGLTYSGGLLKGGNERERMFGALATATIIHFMIAGLTDSLFNIQILRYTFSFVLGVCVRNSLTTVRSS
jgi:O-antigen ligase